MSPPLAAPAPTVLASRGLPLVSEPAQSVCNPTKRPWGQSMGGERWEGVKQCMRRKWNAYKQRYNLTWKQTWAADDTTMGVVPHTPTCASMQKPYTCTRMKPPASASITKHKTIIGTHIHIKNTFASASCYNTMTGGEEAVLMKTFALLNALFQSLYICICTYILIHSFQVSLFHPLEWLQCTIRKQDKKPWKDCRYHWTKRLIRSWPIHNQLNLFAPYCNGQLAASAGTVLYTEYSSVVEEINIFAPVCDGQPGCAQDSTTYTHSQM